MYIPDKNLPPHISSVPSCFVPSRPARHHEAGQDSEFTFQQNSWTVLQTAAAPTSLPVSQTEPVEQPPPYTPSAIYKPKVQIRMNWQCWQHDFTVSNLNNDATLHGQPQPQQHDIEITFERPQQPNNASENAQYFRMSSKTSFDDGFRCICKEMGLDFCAATHHHWV